MPNVNLPIWAYVLIAAVLVTGVQQWRISVAHMELAQAHSKYDKHIAEDARLAQKAADEQREEEQRRQLAVNKIQEEAANEIAAANAAADTANADADSLRRQVDKLLAARKAGSNSSATAGSETTGLAFGVLAELFNESVRRNQVLAEALDRSRIAGMTCQRSYGSISHETTEH